MTVSQPLVAERRCGAVATAMGRLSLGMASTAPGLPHWLTDMTSRLNGICLMLGCWRVQSSLLLSFWGQMAEKKSLHCRDGRTFRQLEMCFNKEVRCYGVLGWTRILGSLFQYARNVTLRNTTLLPHQKQTLSLLQAERNTEASSKI